MQMLVESLNYFISKIGLELDGGNSNENYYNHNDIEEEGKNDETEYTNENEYDNQNENNFENEINYN